MQETQLHAQICFHCRMPVSSSWWAVDHDLKQDAKCIRCDRPTLQLSLTIPLSLLNNQAQLEWAAVLPVLSVEGETLT